MDEALTIAAFDSRQHADQLTSRLRASGFDADVFDESAAQKWLLLNLTPRAHMRVRVPKEEGERALKQIHEWDAEDSALAQAVRCPQCASSRIEYPQFSRRTLMSAFPAAAAAAGIIEKMFYCESCGFTWEADPKPAPEMDVLNWPKG